MALQHQVHINEIQLVRVPIPVNQLNQFDELGSLVSLKRLRGEENAEFRHRVRDTFVHVANSSYRGLVHGITRELGLSLFDAIIIQPKRAPDGGFLASDPYISFDGVWLLLYSDYKNELLDWAIDRYQQGGNYEHLGKLVQLINTTSFFEAYLLDGVDPYTRSMTILNQSSREQVRMETTPMSDRFRLKHVYPARHTLFFSDRDTFREEVTSVGAVTGRGKYHVDYTTGIVTSYSIPPTRNYVRYQYTKYPFRAIASPVILHDINNENFKVKMFEQIALETGEEVHGLPNKLGTDIINELMSVTPMYWGI